MAAHGGKLPDLRMLKLVSCVSPGTPKISLKSNQNSSKNVENLSVEWSDRAQTFAFASKHVLSILVKFGHHRSTLDRVRVTFSPNLMLFLELCVENITKLN